MLGKKLSPILEEIEVAIIEFDCTQNTKPNYTDAALRAAAKIFISVLMDKMWELQEKKNMPFSEREKMATQCGKDLRQLLKTYTDTDSFEFYNETIVGRNFIISKSVK